MNCMHLIYTVIANNNIIMLKNCYGRQCEYFMGAGVCLIVYVHTHCRYVHHHLPHTQGMYILATLHFIVFDLSCHQ